MNRPKSPAGLPHRTRRPVKRNPQNQISKAFAERLAKFSLSRLLEVYQSSSGTHFNLAQEEILRRRQEGKLDQGTPLAIPFDDYRFNLPPVQLKQLRSLYDACLGFNFIQADNAIGGGLVLRHVKRGVSADSVLLRLAEDAKSLPQGAKVYFRLHVLDEDLFGVTLHVDHDDFVVSFHPTR